MSKQQFLVPPASVRTTVLIELAEYGTAEFSVFDGLADGRTDHASITFRRSGTKLPLVRTHSECLTGDVFGSRRCDCGPQLDEALRRCSQEGGTILYLRQEGRGIGLASKIEAYALQDVGLNTFAANRALGFADDARDFRVAAQMLEALGHQTIRLLTNNPDKVAQLERFGITVACCEPTVVSLSPHNRSYLAAKRDHAGHRLIIDDPTQTLEMRHGQDGQGVHALRLTAAGRALRTRRGGMRPIMGMAVELFVRETPPLRRFLVEGLGYEVENAEAGFVAMHRDGAAVYLRQGFDGLGEDHPFAGAAGQRLGLGIEVVLDAEDLGRAHRTAVAMGFEPTPVTAAPWGGADFRLAVPDGFYLRIRESARP